MLRDPHAVHSGHPSLPPHLQAGAAPALHIGADPRQEAGGLAGL